MDARFRRRLVRAVGFGGAGVPTLAAAAWAWGGDRVGLQAYSVSGWWVVPLIAWFTFWYARRRTDPALGAHRDEMYRLSPLAFQYPRRK